ncbi:MAG: efflux RND transporter periplasmic adaptor subunit [Sphingomonadales bacterium]
MLGGGVSWWLLTREQAGDAQPDSGPVAVQVAPVRQAPARLSFQGIGRVMARDAVAIAAEASGRITAIAANEGAAVAQGDVLIELDMRDEAAALAAAEAALQQAQARYRRDQQLFQQGHVAQARLDQSLAARDAARADVEAAQVAVANRRIIAPFAGRVGLIALSVGDYVRPGDPLFSLLTDRLLEIEIAVPAPIAADIAKDAPVTLWPGQDRALTTRLAARDPAADPQTNTVTLKAVLEDPPAALAPGQSVAVAVLRARRDNALFVPEKAVLMAGPQHYVLLVDDEDVVHRQTVSIGLRRAGTVEIREGLDADDRVIVEGVQKVDDGQKVSPEVVSPDQGGQPGALP